jgi:hypothetical protein
MKRRWWHGLFYSRFFSPKGFLFRATGLTAMFLVVHALGGRAYTSILCGTSPTGKPLDAHTALFGAAYAALYLLTVTLVPVLVLAAAMFLLLIRWTERKGESGLQQIKK